MNEKLDFIFKRRSVRAYENKPVSDELVTALLEAAMAAPSACAADPWHFIVVRDKKRLEGIAEALPYGKMLPKGDVGIVVCGDLVQSHSEELSYMIQDCSAAIENLLLAADSLGLGACWLGVHPREDRVAHIRKLFDLPENIIPLSAIAIGYPAEQHVPRTRYRDEAVHLGKW